MSDRPESSAETDAESRQEAGLRQAVTDAKGAYQEAKILAARLAEMAEDLSFLHPDGTTARHQTLRIERAAVREYTRAAKALSDFVLSRTDPANLSAGIFDNGSGRSDAPSLSEGEALDLSSGVTGYLSLTSRLLAERTWFRALLAGISVGVIATDARGCVCLLNDAAQKLTRWSPDEAIGKTIEQVCPFWLPAGQPIEEHPLRQALRSAAPALESFTLRTRTGEELRIETSAAPLLDGSRVAGAALVLLDHSLQRGPSRDSLLALSAHLMLAQEEEKRRVARELHDDLSQQVAMAAFEAGRIARLLPDAADEVRGKIDSLLGQFQKLNIRLHDIANGLYPAALEDLGLPAAIRVMAQEYRDAGADVHVTIHNIPEDLPISVRTALFRIVQEGLRNARKHAPAAAVRLTLIRVGPELRLTIEDTGPGFDLLEARRQGGLGLLGMEERARLAGGSLLVRTTPDGGTQLLVRVPVGVG